MRFNLNDFKKICQQWGYWATPRIGTEYPSVTPSIPTPLDEYCGKVDPINEVLAMEIERCVLVMREVAPELYDLFMATYVYRLPICDERCADGSVRLGILTRFNVKKRYYHSQMEIALTSLKLMLSRDRRDFF